MKKVLVVVDMLNDFVHEDGSLNFEQAREITPAVVALVKEYQENNDDIVYLCDSHKEDDLEFDRFEKHAVTGTWGAQVIDDLEVGKWRVPKTRYSGFYGTNLEAILNILKPELVEVCGVCTSICVMDTVGGLANRDYNVRVVEDAVADFDEEMHNFSLVRMANLYNAQIWPMKIRKEFD